MPRALFVLLAVLTLALAACSDEPDSPEPTPSPVAPAETSTPAPTHTRAPEVTPTPPPPDTPTTAPEPTSTAPPEPTSTPPPQPPTPTPVVTSSAVVVSRGPADRREVVLTFDAGADAGFTRQVLDVLAAEGIRASFGLTGRWAEQNPALVQAIAAAGHELINHSYDHGSFTGLSTGGPPLSQAARWEQLDRTEAIVQGLTGRTTRPFFRPPYGDYDDSVNRDIALRGYAYNIMWTVDSRGWQGIPAQDIVDRCLAMAVPGAIYVFHVGSSSQDAAALPAIIAGLRAAGYGFTTLSEMLPAPGQ